MSADTPWKEILETYFREFMAFFFPEAEREIDWRRKYEFLDKELQQIAKDAEIGRRFADKLVRVYLRDGRETWVLIHVEIQGTREKDFEKRIYRIGDRYDRPVASFAVLCDGNWRPTEYRSGIFGTETRFRFATAKLLDFQDTEITRNPFSVVTKAHLAAERHKPADRYEPKFALMKRLYESGFERREIVNLFRFIDWIMDMPDNLTREFMKELSKFEEAKRMPYVTSIERLGIKKGIEQGIIIGEEKGQRRLIKNLLVQKFGKLSRKGRKRLSTMTAEQALSEFLLDFQTEADLTKWLDR